jgi:hypothetical protein
MLKKEALGFARVVCPNIVPLRSEPLPLQAEFSDEKKNFSYQGLKGETTVLTHILITTNLNREH